MKKGKIKIEELIVSIWIFIKSHAELILSSLALIISVLVALINFLYNHFKDKDYIEVRFANPIYFGETVYISEHNGQSIISPNGGAYFTWIYVTNASNHDVGYYDFELYLNGEKLSRIQPHTNAPLYVKDGGGKVPIAYLDDLSNGNILARSQKQLKVASTGFDIPIDPNNENEVVVSLSFIKANFWSFLPYLGNKMNHNKVISHTFTGKYVKKNSAVAMLDEAVVKRV
ncbi:hypothetical protein E4T89_11375 [Jeotgalicoccus nanhaiensis]|uniref:Uncharacterized protein n=1 Tax=Jeotgalicoccus nanhaiensis TaxID=568603 RepID=A0ABR9Y195_9STAP|nr:hypothetical protein [Jeotgalicoccus nanhaiensis]MBF0754845.1 hypothetical protein [Jeotgalicoccus nanhaiensis]TFU60716.1 hypothetical protein E4T89_11375 [Jeotgalicoccus nanhaiensis]